MTRTGEFAPMNSTGLALNERASDDSAAAEHISGVHI